MTAHACLELYAEAFEQMNVLGKFEEFASFNGPRFYGFPPSEEELVLVRETWKVKEVYEVRAIGITETEVEGEIRPFRLGEEILWKLAA